MLIWSPRVLLPYIAFSFFAIINMCLSHYTSPPPDQKKKSFFSFHAYEYIFFYYMICMCAVIPGQCVCWMSLSQRDFSCVTDLWIKIFHSNCCELVFLLLNNMMHIYIACNEVVTFFIHLSVLFFCKCNAS